MNSFGFYERGEIMTYLIKILKQLLMVSLFASLFLNLQADSPKILLVDINNSQSTSNFYESMLNSSTSNEALLHLFFTKMPKGGDLHHHYSGSIYAESI